MMQSVENFDHIYDEPINETASQYYPFKLQEVSGNYPTKYHLNADLYSFKSNTEAYQYPNKQNIELYDYHHNETGHQLMQHIEEPGNYRVNLYDKRNHFPIKQKDDNYNSSNTNNSNFNQHRDDIRDTYNGDKPTTNLQSTYDQRVHNDYIYPPQQRCWRSQMGDEFNSQPQFPPSRGSRFRRGGRGRGVHSFDHGHGYFPNKRFGGRRNRNLVNSTMQQPFNDARLNQNQQFESDIRFSKDSASSFPCKFSNAPEKRHKCVCKSIENHLGSIPHGERVNNHHDFHMDTSPIVQNQNRPKSSRWGPSLNTNGDFSNQEHHSYSRSDRRFIPSRSRKQKSWTRFGTNNSFKPGFVPKIFKRDYEKPFRKKRESQQSIPTRVKKPCLQSRRLGSSPSEGNSVTERVRCQKQREYYHDSKLKVEAWFETCLFDEIPTEDEFEESQLQGQKNQYLLMEESCDLKIAMSDISKEEFCLEEQSSINGGKTPSSFSSSVSRGSVSGANSVLDLNSNSSSTTIPYPPERYTVTRLSGNFGCDPYSWLDYKNLLLPLRVNLIFKQITRVERVFLPLPFQHLPDLNEVTLFSYKVTKLCYTVPQILALKTRGNFGVECIKSVVTVKVTKKRRKKIGIRKKRKKTKSTNLTVQNNDKTDERQCHVATIDTASPIMVATSTSINFKHPKKRYQEWKETETDRNSGDSGSNPRNNSKLEICKTTCPKKRFLAEDRSWTEYMKGEIKNSFAKEPKTVKSSPFEPEIDSLYISEPIPISVIEIQTTDIFTEPIKSPIEKSKSPIETIKSPIETIKSPIEPTKSPTEPTKLSTEPTKLSTEPTKSPTEPTKSPTEPTKSPTPTEPTKSPTEPTNSPAEPTKSSTEPTKSSTEPIKSATERTKSATERTKSPIEPTQSTTEPTQSPTEPTQSPTEPTQSPTEPTQSPTEPTQSPTEPTQSPTEPTQSPIEKTKSPTKPTKSPAEPTKSPTEPTKSPTEPTKSPTEPTKSPTEPTKSPTEPTKSPTEPTKSPTEPTKSSTEPTKSSTEPTKSSTEPTKSSTEPTKSSTEPTKSSTEPTKSSTEPTKSSTEPTKSSTEPTKSSTQPTKSSTQPTKSSTQPTKSSTEPTKFRTEPSNHIKFPKEITTETLAEPTELTKLSYKQTNPFVKKSLFKPTETSTVPSMEYDNNLPSKRRTLLRTPSPTSSHPIHQTNHNYNNNNQTHYSAKPTSFSEQAHSYKPSGYNKVPSYRDEKFINNYPRTLADEDIVPPGVSPNLKDVLNYSTNHSSCNSDVYAPDSAKTSRVPYPETLKNPTGPNPNWGGPSLPQYTNCFPNYPKCVPPPMVNFCLPPQPIFPSFQIPLYPQPPNGNIFLNCPAPFGFADPMYCNNLTQSMPYSSPKEVEMETDEGLSEIRNLGTKGPVGDSNRDPRLKPCAKTKPCVEVTLEESPTKNKPVAKNVNQTFVFANPLIYTDWRTPVLIEGIISPAYHNPKNNGHQFKNIVKNNCEDPRPDLIQEIEPSVSTNLKEHCTYNGDPRLRFMTGLNGRKIKWKLGALPQEAIPTADAIKTSSTIINPNTENEMPSAYKLLNRKPVEIPTSPESPIHFESKSTKHSSVEVSAKTIKPTKRHKKTATIFPLKKIKLLEPEKQLEELNSAHIVNKMDLCTNNLDHLLTPTRVNKSKKSTQDTKSMEKEQMVNFNEKCETKVKKKKLRMLEETLQNEGTRSQSPKSSKAKSGSKSSSMEESVDVASKLDSNNNTTSKVKSVSKLRSNPECNLEENIYESNDGLDLKVNSSSRSNSGCISEKPLCRNNDDLDVKVKSRSRSNSDCILDEAIHRNRVELEMNVTSKTRCNFDEEQRNRCGSMSDTSKEVNKNLATKVKYSSGDSDEFEFDESLEISSVTKVQSSSKTSSELFLETTRASEVEVHEYLDPCSVKPKPKSKSRHTVQREDEDNQAMPNNKSKKCSKSPSLYSQNEADNVEHTAKAKPSSTSEESPINDAVHETAKLRSNRNVGSNSCSEYDGEESDVNKDSKMDSCKVSHKDNSGSKSRPTIMTEDTPANKLRSHSKENLRSEESGDETNRPNKENHQIESKVRSRSRSNMQIKSSPKYVLVESDHNENEKHELSPGIKSRLKLEENENQIDDTDIYNFAQDMSLGNDLNIASSVVSSVKLKNGIESLDEGSKVNVAGHGGEMPLEQNKLEKHIEKSSDLFEEVKSANLSLKFCSILNLVKLRERLVQVQNETNILIKQAQVQGISTNDFGPKLLAVILTNCEAYLKEVEYVLFNSTPDTSRVKENTQTPNVKIKKETSLDNIITLSSDSEVEQSPRKMNIKVEEPSTGQYLFSDCIPVRVRSADLNSSPSTKFTIKFDQFCQTPIAVKQESISTSCGNVSPSHGVAEANLFGNEYKLGIVGDQSNFYDSDDNSVASIPVDNTISSWGQRKIKNRPKRGRNIV